MTPMHKLSLSVAAVCIGALSAVNAHATTTPDPGDYNPAPAGTDLGLVYFQRQYADDIYANGNKATKNVGLGLDLAILRNVAYFSIGDLAADWQVILPMAREHTDISNSQLTGVGDATIGGTVWTLSHPDKAEYLGWSAFLTVPTGARSAQGIAVSNDRYALDLQSGYTRSLGGAWSMDLVGQTEIYTRSGNTHIKNDPMYRVFASVRYAVTGSTFLELIVRQTWGEHEDELGDVLEKSENASNVAVGINSFVTQRFQVQLQLADDVHVENGPRFRGLQTRFAYVF